MIEKTPIGRINSLAASAEEIIGNIGFVKPRTMTVTARVNYNAAATAGIRVNLYFSPDGKNYDTVPYTSFDVNLTAGATIQETHIIDAPEEGYMKISVENLDAVHAAIGIYAWVTIQEWQGKR